MTLGERVAHAQPINDADRKAARDLFMQGADLQNRQQFAEALDRFQRAQQVINAPTHLLHIAECQAALNKLVEATETYHQLALWRAAPGTQPPAAFVAAQQQGAAELQQIEPNVPELKVDVVPNNIPTLNVTIDDQPLLNALVGVSRPINPGVHKIVASAPGYSRDEKTIDVKTKSRPSVTLSLQSTGGVVYGAAGTSSTPAGVTLSGGPSSSAGSGAPAPPPPYEKPAVKPDARSRTSIFLGPRLGLYAPGGDFPDTSSPGNTRKLGDVSKTGADFGAEVALRFARLFYFGLEAEYAALGGVDAGTTSYKSSTSLVGGTFGVITNPDGFAFLANIGIGYRNYSVTQTVTRVLASSDQTLAVHSPELQLGAGLHFKAGIVRLVPKIEIDFGSFQGQTGDGSTVTGLNGTTASNPISSVGHVFVFFGMGGYFDINLDKKAAAVAQN